MKMVILDRDGVINYDSKQFIKSPAEWRPIPGSLEALAKLTEAGYRVVVDAGRTETPWTLEDWLDEAQRRGAGEVLLTSMDQDGSNAGYDLESLRIATARLRIPLIASGGFGEARHALEAFRAGADAALVASALHTGGLTVRRLKEQLANAGVEVRSC